jgi:histone deacetylase complex regulatory component SIN3
MTVKSRYQKLNQQLYHSSQEAIRTAQQAHNAVTQAQSSLLPQEIQYAEHKVCEALSYLRQVQDQLQNPQ